jgi:hypothetical protein
MKHSPNAANFRSKQFFSQNPYLISTIKVNGKNQSPPTGPLNEEGPLEI